MFFSLFLPPTLNPAGCQTAGPFYTSGAKINMPALMSTYHLFSFPCSKPPSKYLLEEKKGSKHVAAATLGAGVCGSGGTITCLSEGSMELLV